MKPEELSDWAVLEKYCKPAFDFLAATSDAMDRRLKDQMAHNSRVLKALGDTNHPLQCGERRKR